MKRLKLAARSRWAVGCQIGTRRRDSRLIAPIIQLAAQVQDFACMQAINCASSPSGS